MSKDVDSESLLDLTFLTEEEQSAIVKVLSRDTQLRQKDEGRIRKLRQTISDPTQLKILSGDWFCDVRANRHQGKKFGTDIVQASIRRKKKPKGERERAPWPAVSATEKTGELVTGDVTGDLVSDRSSRTAIVESQHGGAPRETSRTTIVESQYGGAPRETSRTAIVESGHGGAPRETSRTTIVESGHGGAPRERGVPGEGVRDPVPPLQQPAEPQELHDPEHSLDGNVQETSLESRGSPQQQMEEAAPEPAKEPGPTALSGDDSEQKMDEIPLSPVIITVQSDDKLNDQQMNSPGTKKNNSIVSHHIPLKTSSSLKSLDSTKLGGSVMSLYSDGEIGSVEVRGCIQFSLQFDSRKKELLILVIQCRDLAEAKKQRSNPYVKAYLLPDKSSVSKRKTTVKKKCLDPLFNETLKYKIEKSDLQSRVLNLSVWHRDSLGRNLFLGEVEIELDSWDWSQTQPTWYTLQPRTPVAPEDLCSCGKIVFSLKFVPAGTEGGGLPPTGELHIWVKEAQNIRPTRSGKIDSCVKCYVLPDDSKSSRQKTRVVKRSLNPTFNHTMVYDGFRAEDLQEACAEFTLWDQETFSSQQLGGVRLSMGRGRSYSLPVPWMDSTEEEKLVWNTLMQKPNEWVNARLPLRTNLTPRV